MAKNRLGWLALLIAAALAYLFENNTGTRLILVFLTVLPVCSVLWLFAVAKTPFVKVTAASAASRGEEITVNTEITPKRAISGSVTVKNLFTGEEKRLPVTGGSFTAEHFGVYSVRADSLRLYDPLGLVCRRLQPSEEARIRVLPEPKPIAVTLRDSGDSLTDTREYSSVSPGHDPSETFRIREYAPGDPVRQIHWKLSEKTGRTMVRDFGLPIASKALLLFETLDLTGRYDLDAADRALTTLASISAELMRQEIIHTIYDSEITRPGDLEVCLEALLSAPLGGSGETVCARYLDGHLSCDFEHAAIISPFPVTDAADVRGTVIEAGAENVTF